MLQTTLRRRKTSVAKSANVNDEMPATLSQALGVEPVAAQTESAQRQQLLGMSRVEVPEAANRVRLESKLNALSEAMAEMRNTLARSAVQQDRMESKVDQTIRQADKILRVTANIQTMSRQIKTGVADIQRRIRNRDTSLLADILANEWFAVFMLFLTHPFIPYEAQGIATVWGILLSIRYPIVKAVKLVRGDIRLQFEGGPLMAAKSLIFSAPHAIYLMFELSNRWNRARVGADAEYRNVFGDSQESAFIRAFGGTIQHFREFMAWEGDMSGITETVGAHAKHLSEIEWAAMFERMSGGVSAELREIDSAMFEDWPGFLQLLARYCAGKLVFVTAEGVRMVLKPPAYIYQLRTLVDVERHLLGIVMGFVAKLFGESFKQTTAYIHDAICAYLCLAPAAGGGLTNYFTAAASSATQVLTAATSTASAAASTMFSRGLASLARCDCSKYGKVKMDGGTRSRRSKGSKGSKGSKTRKRRSTRSRLQALPSNHAEFIEFMWNASMLLLGPTATPRRAELEARGLEILERKMAAGEFVPILYITNIPTRVLLEPFDALSA